MSQTTLTRLPTTDRVVEHNSCPACWRQGAHQRCTGANAAGTVYCQCAARGHRDEDQPKRVTITLYEEPQRTIRVACTVTDAPKKLLRIPIRVCRNDGG
jgi:hypothetical protein